MNTFNCFIEVLYETSADGMRGAARVCGVESLKPRVRSTLGRVPSRTQDRTRAVDIARTAGISVQQVRNYVDLGVLPPVERTPSGYRIFTADHAAAVVAVRRMAAGHGWARTRAIMRAVHAGDLDTALAELDSGHSELDRERAEIVRVLAAVDELAAAVPPPAATRRGPLRVGEVARVTGVRTSALRLWERHGLLRPSRDASTGYRAYDAAELRNARVVALLRRGGYPIPIVRAVLDELRTTGDPSRVRAELSARERDLAVRSRNRLAASAALNTYLDHRTPPPPRTTPA
jgi:DNA-binding transcriptional MerR regulator